MSCTRLDPILSRTIITKRPMEFPNDPLIHCYNPGGRTFFHSSSSDCRNLQGMIHLRGPRMIARIKSVPFYSNILLLCTRGVYGKQSKGLFIDCGREEKRRNIRMRRGGKKNIYSRFPLLRLV
ncbi:hypothetical protein TNIN_386771 [Trichonephila inaurata madagascariensis]|uniref:Uncharacterized protein n=1 Tax=Trichonephila inaurata madagascariensis TaxID=2747483 RepID=A0A8X7C248_9ARAC|nr:hypothetical protein TNIN_386771 [Trichonephila inaurata madagascariensis]